MTWTLEVRAGHAKNGKDLLSWWPSLFTEGPNIKNLLITNYMAYGKIWKVSLKPKEPSGMFWVQPYESQDFICPPLESWNYITQSETVPPEVLSESRTINAWSNLRIYKEAQTITCERLQGSCQQHVLTFWDQASFKKIKGWSLAKVKPFEVKCWDCSSK